MKITNATMLVRNRLPLTVQAMFSMEMASQDMNLTILDDRSDEPTVEMLDNAARGATFHLVRNDIPKGTAELRNQVIEASQIRFGRHDYLYLGDNDLWYRQGWLEELVHCYEVAWKYGFKVIGAYNHPFHRPINNLPIYGQYSVNETLALATQSMLMKWEVWDQYGPFCKTPVDRVCMSEDVDFTNRIRKDGGRIGVISPAVAVGTGITNTFGEKIPGWEAVLNEVPKGVIVL